MSESQLVNAIIRRCYYEKSWLSVDRANSGAKSFIGKNGDREFIRGHKAGTPDITGYFAPLGRYIGIEAKLPGKKQNDNQIEFEKDVRQKGGLYFVVRDLDELEIILNNLKGIYAKI